MLNSSIKDTFDKEGCVLVKDVISRELAFKIRERVVRLAADEKESGESYTYKFDESGKTQRVWNLVNKGKVFRDLLEIDLVDEIMNYIFDRDTTHQKYHLSSFQANILYPGCDRQKLHVDTPIPQPMPPYPVKANSIWLLDDFTEENGATEYIAGSQKNPNKPTADEDKALEVLKATGTAGSVLFTHGNLWHRAGANKSSKPRIGLLCSFAASYALEIAHEEDQSIIIGNDIKDGMSDRLKRIIGVGHGIKDGALFVHKD